ncbi:MAG: c-type cytochrome, partial [Myxococcota bacterium]
LPIIETVEQTLPAHELPEASAESVAEGRSVYNLYCAVCHGGNVISGGIVPDLRYRIEDLTPIWNAIVHEGALAANGMPGWKEYLTAEEATAIQTYVAYEASLGHARGERRVVRR